MSGENLDSPVIIDLDTFPIQVPSAGEGAPGYEYVLDDVVLPTASVAEWSTYRLARFPTSARIKHVWLYTKGIDSSSSNTAKLDINVAFSDSATDGTPPSLTGAIPSSNFDGTAYPFVSGTGYSGSYPNSGTGNKLFGSAVTLAASGAAQWEEITYKNTFTPAGRLLPLWDFLGFTDLNGNPQDPGGMFDIVAVVSAAVATAAAGTIGVELDYVV